MDEDTRRMILHKTWCHGQVIAPAFGLVCLIWFFHHPSLWLLYAGIVLPVWSYVSYRSVFVRMQPWHLIVGGVAVELAYVAVLLESIPGARRNNNSSSSSSSSSTSYMLLCIASGLLAFETLAFLVVALTLHWTTATTSTSRTDYRDLPSTLSAIPTTNIRGGTPSSSRGSLA